MVAADFVQDGGTVTGTVTFAEGSAAPFEFTIQSGTISTAGALRLTFDAVEVPGPVPGARVSLTLTWEAQADATGMTGTVAGRSTSTNTDVLPGTAVFEGCLGPVFFGGMLGMAAMTRPRRRASGSCSSLWFLRAGITRSGPGRGAWCSSGSRAS